MHTRTHAHTHAHSHTCTHTHAQTAGIDVTAENAADFDLYLTSLLDPDVEEVSFVRGDYTEEGEDRILKMYVPYPWYAVMTAHPGGYGEKTEEYRVETPGKTYWKSRLAGRDYDIVKIYGGTRCIDERACWTMFRCKYVKDIIPENGTLTIGPYSNGQMATARSVRTLRVPLCGP
jgi:hypothetical protein